jgi:hypothetical protein
MTQFDTNILATLNVLCLLLSANKQRFPKFSEEEICTLTVTKEHLQNDNIPTSVFINSIQILADKGYLFATCIYEAEYYDKLRNVFSDEVYLPAMKQIEESGKNLLSEEQKLNLARALEQLVPQNLKSQFDISDIVEEDIKVTDLFDDTRKVMRDIQDGVVAKVVLMPFRDIDRVRNQMNENKSFAEIIDVDVWYNEETFEFRLAKEIIPTSYQTKPNVEHYILRLIPAHLDDGVIWYDEIEDRTSRSIKDALLKFVSKNAKLKDIFTIHSNRIEFDIEAFK